MKRRRVDWIGNLPLMDANEAKRKERKEVGAEWVDQSFVNTKLRSCRFTLRLSSISFGRVQQTETSRCRALLLLLLQLQEKEKKF